jgi:putative colanic acid biosynthesis acetyltransferase WcaF
MGGVKVWMPWNLTISDFTAIGRNVEIYNFAEISIGSNTVISQYSYLCSATHDYTHPHMTLTWFPITIGNSCWLAADTFVAPGVSIGDGCVIGARSVVTKSMPEWSVCAGNPCRALKPRAIKPL